MKKTTTNNTTINTTTNDNGTIRTPFLYEGKIVDKGTLDFIKSLENSILSRSGLLILVNKPVRNDKDFNDRKRRLLWSLADELFATDTPSFSGELKKIFNALYDMVTGFNGVTKERPIIVATDLNYLKSSLLGNLKRKENECYIIPTENAITLGKFEKAVDILCFSLAVGFKTDFFSDGYKIARDKEEKKILEIQQRKADKEKAKAEKKALAEKKAKAKAKAKTTSKTTKTPKAKATKTTDTTKATDTPTE